MRFVETINSVCAEGRWMETPRYIPTPIWEHALTDPDCPCHLLLVVADRDRIAGWCRAFPDGSANSAEIGIGLLRGYRNQGMGTRLLQETIRWARQSGFTCLTLTTRADNARAIHVFRKVGFMPTGRTGQGQVEMVYRLGNSHRDKETEL